MASVKLSVVRGLLLLILIALALGVSSQQYDPGSAAASDISVDLTPDLPSGQPVGTKITWTVTASGPGPLVYRFSVGRVGEPLRVVYDFSPRTVFEWTPIEDGDYLVRLVAWEESSSQMAAVNKTYVVQSRVNETPIVTPTAHPLVALYSAPPCDSGEMRVRFHRWLGRVAYFTDSKPCDGAHSMNFYVAGMRADTFYLMRHEILDEDGNVLERGPRMFHRTGSVDLEFPSFTALVGPDSRTSLEQSVLLHAPGFGGGDATGYPVATDFAGEVIWYFEPPIGKRWAMFLVRPAEGGTMFLIGPGNAVPSQVIWEVDLAGNIVRETNARRVSEQLVAMGQDPIGSFHHEVVRFPNGQTLVLGKVERILEDVQGPGPIDIMGDMVIALDEDWQVVWAWNAFNHLDVTRMATLGETCNPTKVCPPLFLAEEANDWLHTNSIGYSPADGNLIISIRNQDWVAKLDYRDGTGTGEVLWRLGLEGDFTMISDDPFPWFTHQHDARYISDDQIILYDNQTLRCATDPTPLQDCFSRGQVLNVDEEARVVTLELSADLGNYSPGFGSAQELLNGNYFFTSGYNYPGGFSTADELLPDSTKIYSVKAPGVLMYRSFRMTDLYTP